MCEPNGVYCACPQYLFLSSDISILLSVCCFIQFFSSLHGRCCCLLLAISHRSIVCSFRYHGISYRIQHSFIDFMLFATYATQHVLLLLLLFVCVLYVLFPAFLPNNNHFGRMESVCIWVRDSMAFPTEFDRSLPKIFSLPFYCRNKETWKKRMLNYDIKEICFSFKALCEKCG